MQSFWTQLRIQIQITFRFEKRVTKMTRSYSFYCMNFSQCRRIGSWLISVKMLFPISYQLYTIYVSKMERKDIRAHFSIEWTWYSSKRININNLGMILGWKCISWRRGLIVNDKRICFEPWRGKYNMCIYSIRFVFFYFVLQRCFRLKKV